MCLLFLYLNNNAEDSEYRLILANNRDEYWVRPTEKAAFRGSHPRWIGGADLEPGKDGGTWMGMSTMGKLGVVLNVLTPYRPSRKGRGFLVTDFLTGDHTSEGYIQHLIPQATQYKPFHLLLLDLSASSNIHYLNNSSGTGTHSEKLPPGIYSFGNSNDLGRPWRKQTEGQNIFTQSIQEHHSQNKDILVDQLLDLLNDKTCNYGVPSEISSESTYGGRNGILLIPNGTGIMALCYSPDEQLEKQFQDAGRDASGGILKQTSAVNVFSPTVQFGTRTNTVLLVDKQGNCDYIERTLETPVNTVTPKWHTLKYKFSIAEPILNSD